MKPANHDVQQLEAEHRDLEAQVKSLTRRAYLTPGEQQQVAELKKKKLDTKDRLYALREEEHRD